MGHTVREHVCTERKHIQQETQVGILNNRDSRSNTTAATVTAPSSAELGHFLIALIRSPLAFASPELESMYQASQASPDLLLNASLCLSLIMKVVTILRVLKKSATPASLTSLHFGTLSTVVALSLFICQHRCPAFFRQFWQHLSLLHIITSAAHAMSTAPILASTDAVLSGSREVPMSVYVRTFLESSSAIPLVAMSITTLMSVWPLLGSYAAIVFLMGPTHNRTLCREIQNLPGQQEIYAAAARGMKLLSDLGGLVFAAVPVRLEIASPASCEVTMQSCQVAALAVVILIHVARESHNRRLFLAKPWAQRHIGAADRDKWISHSSELSLIFITLAKTLFWEFLAVWYILLLVYPVASVTDS
eukprot:jgi/Botrbrau1/8801/Bobra.0330s0032.1